MAKLGPKQAILKPSHSLIVTHRGELHVRYSCRDKPFTLNNAEDSARKMIDQDESLVSLGKQDEAYLNQKQKRCIMAQDNTPTLRKSSALLFCYGRGFASSSIPVSTTSYNSTLDSTVIALGIQAFYQRR